MPCKFLNGTCGKRWFWLVNSRFDIRDYYPNEGTDEVITFIHGMKLIEQETIMPGSIWSLVCR
jgi:hypothetical protein